MSVNRIIAQHVEKVNVFESRQELHINITENIPAFVKIFVDLQMLGGIIDLVYCFFTHSRRVALWKLVTRSFGKFS